MCESDCNAACSSRSSHEERGLKYAFTFFHLIAPSRSSHEERGLK